MKMQSKREKSDMTEIKVTIRSVDGGCQTRKYKKLVNASQWARAMLGNYPTFGSNYAVSDDGICTARVQGATLAELFPGAE